MPKKPETFMQSVDGEMLRVTPMTEVSVALVLLHKPDGVIDLIMTATEYGDGEGEEHMQDFIENATHALEPGETLQRRTVTFSRAEIDAKLLERRDLD